MGEITGITITEEIEEYRRKIALLGTYNHVCLCIYNGYFQINKIARKISLLKPYAIISLFG